jgi:hypothetical protein
MRFDEFENNARKQLAERHDLTEEQLDEILPAIGAIGAGLARVAGTAAVRGGAALARGAARGAAALGRAAAKGVGAAAGAAARGVGKAATGAVKGTAKAVGNAASGAARGAARSVARQAVPTNDPNDTVGSQSTQGTQGTQSAQDKKAQKDLEKQLKPGKVINLPSMTKTGKPGPTKKFKVTRNAKGEVELQNPLPKPGEPKKFVYNQDELAGVLDANK